MLICGMDGGNRCVKGAAQGGLSAVILHLHAPVQADTRPAICSSPCVWDSALRRNGGERLTVVASFQP
jgi:hypothetical protein